MEANNRSAAVAGQEGRLLRLRCSVKSYDWGRIGRESSVARLYERNCKAEAEDGKPYAEFWMGTHDSGPSYVAPETATAAAAEKELLSLKDLIEKNPRAFLGDKVYDRWGPNLPFLFKVLSIAKALSIQAHPNKELATILHKAQPNVYKDPNHKPEMALALTEFEALCGFISLEELKSVVHNVPEIVEVVGTKYVDELLCVHEEDVKKAKEVLQLIFTQLMAASKDVIAQALSRLISRLSIKNEARELTDKEHLVLRLEKQYPADIGLLAAFLLNYIKLKPGQALYLGADEPHAYIYGECIECMATSDNVVRAGLTPKSRDVQTLCSMLTYKQGLPEILDGVALNPYVHRYPPPFDEFEVDRCILPQGSSVGFPSVPGPAIYLVIGGQGTISEELVAEGDVLFSPANTEITVTTTSGLSLYRAGVNSKFF
nr:mannose-6-phosphate isomerase 1-like [Coffea arabica]